MVPQPEEYRALRHHLKSPLCAELAIILISRQRNLYLTAVHRNTSGTQPEQGLPFRLESDVNISLGPISFYEVLTSVHAGADAQRVGSVVIDHIVEGLRLDNAVNE